jgi:hypothetical protein
VISLTSTRQRDSYPLPMIEPGSHMVGLDVMLNFSLPAGLRHTRDPLTAPVTNAIGLATDSHVIVALGRGLLFGPNDIHVDIH